MVLCSCFIPPKCHVGWCLSGKLEFSVGIDSVIDWFTDSSVQWFIDLFWCTDSLIHWVIDSLVRWLPDLFFIESLNHWFAYLSLPWLVDSLNCCVIGLLVHWFWDSLIHCFVDLLIHWSTDSLIRWIHYALVHSVNCAWILSFVVISTTFAHLLMHLTTWTLHCFYIAYPFR